MCEGHILKPNQRQVKDPYGITLSKEIIEFDFFKNNVKSAWFLPQIYLYTHTRTYIARRQSGKCPIGNLDVKTNIY